MRTGPGRTVPLDDLRVDRRFVLREPITDQERVRHFARLYAASGLGALPPIVILDLGDRTLRIVDGHHRYVALRALQRPEALVAPLVVEDAMPIDAALDVAIAAAVETAKNLTRDEQRALVFRLLKERPAWSRREIAKRIGITHTAVNNWVNEAAQRTAEPVQPPADVRAAKRLVRAVVLLDKSLPESTDNDAVAALLADAFTEACADPADWAEYLADIASRAAARLLEGERA